MPKVTKKGKKKKNTSKKTVKSQNKGSKKGPCWTGYHKVKGMKNYSKGSCKKN
jgi:hypothetical protein